MEIDLNNIRLLKDSNGADFCYALYYGEEFVGGIRVNKMDDDEILDDELLKMAVRKVNSVPKYYLDFFYIHDEFRKMGLGRRVLSEVIKDFGSYTMFLKANDENGMGQKNLVRMYERYGFIYCDTDYDGDYMIRPGNVQNGKQTY